VHFVDDLTGYHLWSKRYDCGTQALVQKELRHDCGRRPSKNVILRQGKLCDALLSALMHAERRNEG
jgi:hypothetical protein